MNLRDLRYFVALAEHRHFGRAAESCFASQPTLSTQIRKLEEELGVPLVERSPRRVLLTAAGEAVLAHAHAVLDEVDEIREVARRSQDPAARTVRLGVFPTLGPYLLPHVLPRVRELFPSLELLLVEEKTEEVLARLRDGQLEAVVVALPIPSDGLQTTFLFEEPFVLAVPDRHPLAVRAEVAVDDLAGQSLLLLEDGHCLRDQALAVCQLAHARERNGFRATSLETLRHMVAAGVGITLLPTLATKPPVAPVAGIRIVRFCEDAPQRRIAMVWRQRSPMGGFLKELAKAFRLLPRELLSANAY